MIFGNTSRRISGFTIVELLIVIVVIGILAAITIVAFNGIQRRAAQAVVQSDLSQAIKEIENHRTLNNTLPATAEAVDDGRGLKASEGTTYEYTLTGADYCVTATSPGAQTSYYYDSTVGRTQEGACTGHIGYSSSPGAGVHDLTAGAGNSCRIRDGVPYCWGENGQGNATPFMQIGDGTSTNRTTPVLAGSAGGLLTGKVVNKLANGYYHSCALADGVPYCWGWAYLGNGVNHGTASDPVQVTTSGVLSGKTITDIGAGYRRTCVIADSKPYCWGVSYLGNNGTFATSPVAVDDSGVLSGLSATKIAVGSDSTCVLADGAPYCWGTNSSGQLGDGTTTAKNYPVAVNTAGVLAGRTITDLIAGETHYCVIADGEAFCWGENSYGALGMGAGTTDQANPVAVSTAGVLGGKTISNMALGASSSCAIADDAVYCWGYNIYGQLGRNVQGPWTYASPAAVVSSGVLSGKTLIDVAGGQWHYCVMDSDREHYCWGRNAGGQLGNNSTSDSWVPVVVDPLP